MQKGVTTVILVVAFLIGMNANSKACETPTGLKASNITATSAVLSWTAASGATGYHVAFQELHDGFWVSGNTATTSFTAGGYPVGLEPGTTYHFMVYAVCSDGTSSAYSTLSSFTTLAK
jgi:Fibronectin type III domain